jgi:tight adherence protein C
MMYLITTAVFISVMLLSIAVSYHFLLGKSVLTERLERLFPEKKIRIKPPVESGTWTYKLSRIGETVKLPPQEHSKYTKMLVAAGFRKETIYLFFGSKVVLTGALPLLYLAFFAANQDNHFSSGTILAMSTCAIVGYLLPSYWLYAKKKTRQQLIFHTLPDVLDLMTVCVEAGLSMDAALIRTTETPQFVKDPLAQEIRIVTMETRAGKPRAEALKDMAERTMVDDIRSFTAMLVQTERFGTSLSQAMRTFADSLRIQRRQIAEEEAAKTTIKMIFPLILFIFPALLVVILGPALIQIGRIFK